MADRIVPYHRVDPDIARDLFIRHALVEGEWNTHHAFFHKNMEKLQSASELEDKARRRDIVVDEQTLFDFYDARIPSSVTTGRHFDSWWKKKHRTEPTLLDFDPSKLVSDTHNVSEVAFPNVWRQGNVEYELSYRFEPGTPDDGVTVRIPMPLLAGLTPRI